MSVKRIGLVVAVGLLAGVIALLAIKLSHRTLPAHSVTIFGDEGGIRKVAVEAAIDAHKNLIEALEASLARTNDAAKKAHLEDELEAARKKLAEAEKALAGL